MKILIRLPNWLGDMVMSIYFVREVQQHYPGAEVSVIVKKGLESLLQFFPPTKHQFVFSKAQSKGLFGYYGFGRKVRAADRFDLFFCLPDSFSSALIGWATGAKQRIGFAKEGRSFLLTKSYTRNTNAHRVNQYLQLLGNYTNQQKIAAPDLQLLPASNTSEGIVFNINSEAESRRLPTEKAIAILESLISKTSLPITMIGGPNDAPYTNAVIAAIKKPAQIINKSGNTTLAKLAEIFSKAKAILSTDSGPAHLANAVGLPTVVLFGAGNESETGPYYKAESKVIRLGKLPCEPCRSNTCIFGTPLCLTSLDTEFIVDSVLQMANKNASA